MFRTATASVGSTVSLPDGCEQGYAVVDVETTGLSPASARVIQIGVVLLDCDMRIQDSWSTILDPGCGPGPTHIHGITQEMLVGAPCFDDVYPGLTRFIAGRVFVAHNASFDWSMLAAERARARVALPTGNRLCTLTLARRIDLGVPDARLGTLASYFGVPQARAHDALDDARVTAALLPHLLSQLARLGSAVPFVLCTSRDVPTVFPSYVRKMPCSWRNPGRFRAGGPLVQGMKVAITGDTMLPREDLIKRAVVAGLDVTNAVSARTSLLVRNDRSCATAKAERARAENTPTVRESDFIALLDHVAAGDPKASTRISGATSAVRPESAASSGSRSSGPNAKTAGIGPLSGRRVLIVGGPHDVAVDLRAQVTALGAAAAVNLTASITDVVVLRDADNDPRVVRARELQLACSSLSEFLARLSDTHPSTPAISAQREPAEVDTADNDRPVHPIEPATHPHTAVVLTRGAVMDPPPTGIVTINARWSWGAGEVDLVAFALDEDEQVSEDSDFVFYNQPSTPSGTITLAVDGPEEQGIRIDLDGQEPEVRKIVIAAALAGDETFADVGAIELTAVDGNDSTIAVATLDAATTETEMLLAEVYRRGGVWRLRAVGQGYHSGLASLATSFGVSVEDD